MKVNSIASFAFSCMGCKENTFMITSTVFVLLLPLLRPLPPRLFLVCNSAVKMRPNSTEDA